MKRLTALLLALCFMPVFGCAKTGSAAQAQNLIVSNLEAEVDETVAIDVVSDVPGEISYTFEGDAIAIYDGMARGMAAGTQTVVTATAEGFSGTFTVTVPADSYEKDEDGDWFSDIAVEPVEGLSGAFAMGMDLSTLAVVLQNGGRFYDAAGNRVSVFRLLAQNGVNWIRLRLWNEPYQTGENGEKLYYGGGNCDFRTVSALARDAKALGFSLLLDFHYSDFWADPSAQVIPKQWSNLFTEDEMALAIYDYTYETLSALAAMNAAPDMVQIGNEITSGMLLEAGGADDGTFLGSGYSNYFASRSAANKAVRAPYSGRGAKVDQTLVRYVAAGASAVKAVDDSILIMLQLAKSMEDEAGIKTFFHTFDSVDYDVIGLSYYPRWHGGTGALSQTLSALSSEFPDKQIAIAEVSYAFTLESAREASNQFNASYAADGYDISVQGQANLIRDVIAALSSVDGFGVFYWEGAWLPVSGAGWAGPNTLPSWSNQALFSYDGMALPSLSVFSRVYAAAPAA